MTKYAVTEGDYNDVFAKYEMEFKDYDEAERYAYAQFNPEYKDRIEDISGDSVCLAIYQGVYDDNGNEVNPNDARYEDLSQQQESLIEYYIEIREIED